MYAGIDEAGYGPLLGPMVIARAWLAVPEEAPCDAWSALSAVVCRSAGEARSSGRMAVADSKKLLGPGRRLAPLERGCLSFARAVDGHGQADFAVGAAGGGGPDGFSAWCRVVGTSADLDSIQSGCPWYASDEPMALPLETDGGDIRVTASLLRRGLARWHGLADGVSDTPPMGGLAAAVIREDRFNHLLTRMRTKSAIALSYVHRHIAELWDRGRELPDCRGVYIAVDRQGGRRRYRLGLQQAFNDASMTVLGEGEQRAAYRLDRPGWPSLTLAFQTRAEEAHWPVAMASMIAKYTRELWMLRLNRWFGRRIDGVAPTAGYTTDARRWLEEAGPGLGALGIDPASLCRRG